MASPFAIFRKNQKIMLAAVTLLAMFAFVVTDSFQIGNDGGGGDDPVAVESKFFSMSESQVRSAVADRQVVLQFLARCYAIFLQQQELQQFGPDAARLSPDVLRRITRPYEEHLARGQMIAENSMGPATETSVVDTAALAAEARNLGVAASDPIVEEFIKLRALQGLPIPPEQLNAIFNDVAGGRMTYKQFLGAFRNEMLSWTMQSFIAGNALRVSTPLDRWDYYLRKRCLATAEVIPVSTDEIIKQGLVRKPTESELTAFFDQYRFEEPIPGSPDPGFTIPQKAMFQYAAADEADFLEPEKITVEMITAHYDANKARYPYTPEDFNEPAEDDTAKDDAAKPKEPTKVAPDCDGEFEGDENADADASSCDGADDQAPDAKSTEQSADDKKPEPAKPAASPTATAAASPTATAAAPSATSSAAPAPSPSATASGTSVGAAAPLPPPPLPSENLLLPDDVHAGRNPQYDPLWRVEKKILDELARKAATERATEALKKLRSDLSEAALGRDPKNDKPLYDEKQWEALVAKYPGLVAGSTPLVTDMEAREASENPGFFKALLTGETFNMAAFRDSAVYVPKEAIDVPEVSISQPAGSVTRYVYWKIKNEPTRVPDLADKATHDLVVHAWQTREARPKAREEAEKLAKEARQNPRPLSEQFPSRDVKRTNAFAWYETDLSGGFNAQPQPTRISRVEGVVDAGPEFMQTVFGLDVDQVGTAMNNPQNICYVIRVTSQTPTRSQLYDAFMVENFQTYRQFSQEESMRNGGSAMKSLLAEADIRWLREPRDISND